MNKEMKALISGLIAIIAVIIILVVVFLFPSSKSISPYSSASGVFVVGPNQGLTYGMKAPIGIFVASHSTSLQGLIQDYAINNEGGTFTGAYGATPNCGSASGVTSGAAIYSLVVYVNGINVGQITQATALYTNIQFLNASFGQPSNYGAAISVANLQPSSNVWPAGSAYEPAFSATSGYGGWYLINYTPTTSGLQTVTIIEVIQHCSATQISANNWTAPVLSYTNQTMVTYNMGTPSGSLQTTGVTTSPTTTIMQQITQPTTVITVLSQGTESVISVATTTIPSTANSNSVQASCDVGCTLSNIWQDLINFLTHL